MKKFLLSFLPLLLPPFFAAATELGVKSAEEEKIVRSQQGYSFYIENDSRNMGGPGTDQGYSNGFKFSYVYAEDDIPSWTQTLTALTPELREQFKKSPTNFGISLGQQIFTPNNTDLTSFIPDDRPYSAWLYLGFAAQIKNEDRSHSLEIDLGVIGPEAQGESVQNSFHKMIDVPTTKGWEHQLQTEPTLQLSYQQRLKLFGIENEDMKVFDILPYFGGALGNVLVAAHVGSLLRIGYDLPDDFGPSRPSGSSGDSFVAPSTPRAEQRFSLYGFAGLRGNAIARNIFLDGNTFHSSHKVKKYPFTAETEFGVGLQVGRLGVVWRFVTLSPEFEEKSMFNSYASLSFTYTSAF